MEAVGEMQVAMHINGETFDFSIFQMRAALTGLDRRRTAGPTTRKLPQLTVERYSDQKEMPLVLAPHGWTWSNGIVLKLCGENLLVNEATLRSALASVPLPFQMV